VKQYRVTAIDDDEQFLSSLEGALPDRVSPLCRQFRCVFDFVTSPEELAEVRAAAVEDGAQPAMVISDQLMPSINGIDLIERLKRDCADTVCVLLTGHGGLDSAKYAINRNLLDQYVSKPIEDMDEFAALVANLLKRHHLSIEERERTAQLAETAERLRRSNEQIKAMHAAAEQVALLAKGLKSLDFDEVVQLATREVPRIFQAEWGVLCFPGCDGSVGASRTAYRHGCPLAESLLFARAEAGQDHRATQIHCGEVPEDCKVLGGESPSIVIPMEIGGFGEQGQDEKEGCLCLCRLDASAEMSEEILRYKGDLLRDILSANLANARLYEEARRRSRIDVLTGVSTRRVLEESLHGESDRAVRYKHPFCVAIVDVDNFKQINDAHGHPGGDRILQLIASIMRGEVRTSDVLARYGGDEFAWLMPEARLDMAVAAAERLRRRVAAGCGDETGPVTISCGVAAWSGAPGDTGGNVLRRADAALYQAKRAGRNRVEAADEPRAASTA